jgi:ATP-dependent DNA helicase RecQ
MPETTSALTEATLRGLQAEPKQLPTVWLYDERGSRLYEEITRLPDYYLPRREAEILRERAGAIAGLTQARTLVELGSGAANNVRLLLDALAGSLERFVPLDVSEEALRASAERVADAYPRVSVEPVLGDFERDLDELPERGRRLIAFLGSTIGNLYPDPRRRLLSQLAASLAPDDALLLGLDLVKDVARLEAAYNDADGVTEEFVRNGLTAVNRELDANFDQRRFVYEARWDSEREWMDIGLRAREAQIVSLHALGLDVAFEESEPLRVEISSKFRRERFEAEARAAGLGVDSWWTDAEGDFAVALLRANAIPERSELATRELARERLGFERLRPGQLRAVSAAVEGRDVLAVLPTGGGKSAIYELAGLMRAGPTVVVSPLIALQDDQLAHLRAAGLQAIVLNSQQSARERAAALVAAGDADTFVFLSPEQLSNDRTREALEGARPGLFVVDEAHLVSQWGHDFRTDYLRLGAQADALGGPVRLALTATAAPPVRQEICRRLGLRDPEVVIGNFDRPHIELSARRVRRVTEKLSAIQQAAAELEGSGIVYAATHRDAEDARDALAAVGERVTLYHAGLPAQARREAMTAFLDGSARIVAATVAFGMGIDKPDVRWVLHADPPSSLDAYYQELGRAGRDEKPAHARLLFRSEDFALARHLTARGVSGSVVARVAAELEGGEPSEAGARQRTAALVRLVDLGAAVWEANGDVSWTGTLSVAAAVAASEAETERENEVEGSRLEMMRRYAEHTGCRRSFLLSYFGQDYPGPCGRCDNDREQVAKARGSEPFPVGSRVESDRWGEGTVQRYDGDQLTVLFDDHGYRDLLLPLVLERSLLRPT